jgi:hypothetical protein
LHVAQPVLTLGVALRTLNLIFVLGAIVVAWRGGRVRRKHKEVMENTLTSNLVGALSFYPDWKVNPEGMKEVYMVRVSGPPWCSGIIYVRSPGWDSVGVDSPAAECSALLLTGQPRNNRVV